MKKLQALVLVLSCLFCMHPAFSQPIIKVCGSEDSLAVKEQVAQYLEHLDVRENIRLSIRFNAALIEKQEGMTFCLTSPEPNTYQIIKVWIDARLSKARQSIVLAHEMIHVKQYAKQELQVNSKREVIWKGRKYDNRYTDSRRTPWENEAYRTDNRLTMRYKEQLKKPFEFEKPLTASKINP